MVHISIANDKVTAGPHTINVDHSLVLILPSGYVTASDG